MECLLARSTSALYRAVNSKFAPDGIRTWKLSLASSVSQCEYSFFMISFVRFLCSSSGSKAASSRPACFGYSVLSARS